MELAPITFHQGMRLAMKIGAENYLECSAVTQQVGIMSLSGLKGAFTGIERSFHETVRVALRQHRPPYLSIDYSRGYIKHMRSIPSRGYTVLAIKSIQKGPDTLVKTISQSTAVTHLIINYSALHSIPTALLSMVALNVRS